MNAYGGRVCNPPSFISTHFPPCVFHKKRYSFSALYSGVGDFYHRHAEGGAVMAEQRIGEVMKFFTKPSVAAVKITDGEIRVGDTIKFKGHTTDLTMALDSMEVNNQKVPRAVPGDYIGVKVADRVRPGDEVFKVTAS
jgi:hypothetical protein